MYGEEIILQTMAVSDSLLNFTADEDKSNRSLSKKVRISSNASIMKFLEKSREVIKQNTTY